MGCAASFGNVLKSSASASLKYDKSVQPEEAGRDDPTSSDKSRNPGNADNSVRNAEDMPARACFGAGCYWGTEKFLRHDFAKKCAKLGTITSSAVGFMGPPNAPTNPTYAEVCSGSTGHVEVLHVEYSGGAPFFEAMVRYFYQFHDPTTANRQGNDRGTQYTSVIYCSTQEQKSIAERVTQELQEHLRSKRLICYQESTVETTILPYTIFYPAHDEHQDYLNKNPNGYCNHRVRFVEWP